MPDHDRSASNVRNADGVDVTAAADGFVVVADRTAGTPKAMPPALRLQIWLAGLVAVLGFALLLVWN